MYEDQAASEIGELFCENCGAQINMRYHVVQYPLSSSTEETNEVVVCPVCHPAASADAAHQWKERDATKAELAG